MVLDVILDQLIGGIAGLLVGFVFGTMCGWFLRGLGLKSESAINGRRVAVAVVNCIIVILWTVSVANNIFQFNDSTTPIFLHACMGAVIGYLNENFGQWLLQMLGRTQPKKKENNP